MQTVRFQYAGLWELKDLLRQLPDSTARRVVVQSLKKAAQPIAERARQLAPRDEGKLASSVVIGTTLTRRQKGGHQKLGVNDVEVFVGIKGRTEVTHYAHIVEFGSEKMTPRPFMGPAFEQTKRQAFDILIGETWNNIDKSIKRLRKKGKWND